jgi:predicted ABC-type ATPase
MVEAIADNIYYITTPFGESFEAALDDLKKVVSFAPGGSLQGHGFEVGDRIAEDLGGYIRVVSEDGKDYFIKLRDGDRLTEPPLPFKHGGKVKHSDVTRLATKTNETGDEVVDLTEFYEGGGNVPKLFDVPAQFLDAEGKRKNDRKTIKELTDFVLALPQTKEIYYNDELGDYTPSRKKLHAEIINKFKKEVVCINNDQPIAIFMGGSPASGKSSFLRKYSPFLLKEEILKVDADEVRAMLPEYEGWNAAQTHLETRDIVNILLSNKNIGIPCDFDIIYDGTMNSVKSYLPLMDILRKRGYKIFIVYMDNVPKDVIIKRALERYKTSGRFVPLEVIEDFFSKGKTAFNELKKDVDGYMLIDGSSRDYNVIEEGGIKLPRDREYSKLGTKIQASDIPVTYKKGGLSVLY